MQLKIVKHQEDETNERSFSPDCRVTNLEGTFENDSPLKTAEPKQLSPYIKIADVKLNVVKMQELSPDPKKK